MDGIEPNLPAATAVLEDAHQPSSRGRPAGYRMTEEHRSKIRNSQILNALIEHAEGRREMSASQVAAGLGLLKKVLPDLNAVSLSGDDGRPMKMVIAWDTTSPEREL